METATIERVLAEARIENLFDTWDDERGLKSPELIRSVVIPDAVVDLQVTLLGLPLCQINELGLIKTATKRGWMANGIADINVYDPVRLTIQGRDCVVEVTEFPDGYSAIIGQVPVRLLDFVIDRRIHKLIGDPEHGSEQLLDMF